MLRESLFCRDFGKGFPPNESASLGHTQQFVASLHHWLLPFAVRFLGSLRSLWSRPHLRPVRLRLDGAQGSVLAHEELWLGLRRMQFVFVRLRWRDDRVGM